MELNANQYSDVMNRFPNFELSYETISHKKVPHSYSLCLAIPHGKKGFLWFSFFRNDDVCFFMEMGKDKKVSKIKVLSDKIPVKLAHNTLLYGTICESPDTSVNRINFIIEDIFFYEGIPLKKLTFGEKLGFIYNFFETYASDIKTINNLSIFLPVMWKRESEDDSEIPINLIDKISSVVHHVQHRTLSSVSPYLNVLITRKIGNPLASKKDNLSLLFIPPDLPKYDFTKPQYKCSTIFEVKADLQNDIYHLYAYGEKCKKIYYGLAYIPNYKTSVFMNGIFRKIKENANLDAIEESDDEEDFQDSRIDKYVDLNKTAIVECKFNYKFKKWTPVRSIPKNNGTKITHIGKLTR
jgi:hypothetical protein